MPAATPEQLERLAPYINGAQPDDRGEIEMHCPIHGDAKRSASVNPEKGVWYCHAGCGGGSVRQLVNAEGAWKPVPKEAKRAQRVAAAPTYTESPYTQHDIDIWRERLMDDREALDWLFDQKGITVDTASRAMIGFNGRHYKLPVFGPDRQVWNVRTYDPNPTNGRRKIWSVKGLGQARLYPLQPLMKSVKHEAILFCEGEWDTLLALQAGFLAVTRTDGAGKPWHDEWTPLFKDRRIYICQDRDDAGIKSHRIIGEALAEDAQSVYHVNLPYEVKKKDGHDLSDFLLGSRRAHWYVLGNAMKDATVELKEGA